MLDNADAELKFREDTTVYRVRGGGCSSFPLEILFKEYPLQCKPLWRRRLALVVLPNELY